MNAEVAPYSVFAFLGLYQLPRHLKLEKQQVNETDSLIWTQSMCAGHEGSSLSPVLVFNQDNCQSNLIRKMGHRKRNNTL